jgi:membrane protease YdiL (CAAX protease family)
LTKTCNSCKAPYQEGAKFCTKCGASIVKNSLEVKVSSLNLVIAFYVSIIVFIAISYFVSENYPASFTADITMEILFALLIIGFSLTNIKSIIKLYRFPKLKPTVYIMVFLVPICSAFLIFYGISYIEQHLLLEEGNSYISTYFYLENPLLWSIIFVAILPPIFEELAFRGYLFDQLKKITSEKITIIATAILFALVHFSFLSLLWIFPFGLFLGYLRKKYNTLWLCMIVHFIHNFIVILLDYYYYMNPSFEDFSI